MNSPGSAARWRRIATGLGGLVAGAGLAIPQLVLLALCGIGMVAIRGWSRPRHQTAIAIDRTVRAVTAWEFRRISAYAGRIAVGYTGRRRWLYLFTRPWLGLLAATIGILIGYGVVVSALALAEWLREGTVDGLTPTPGVVAYLLAAGAVLAFLALQGLIGVVSLERRLAVALLGPSPEQLLAERVSALERSRAAVVAAVDAERRRIERDLHDGVQQRAVAVGLLIGRARRGDDADRRERLLEQAHEESRALLSDLREVSWRIYPAALESEGLRAAIESVAERCPVAVAIDVDVPARLDATAETAAYFVVCEAVTNAAKHSGADAVTVSVTCRSGVLRVSVRDDGRGGAIADGGGLSGLARRVAAVDGVFRVTSPPGGPTHVEAELRCA